MFRPASGQSYLSTHGGLYFISVCRTNRLLIVASTCLLNGSDGLGAYSPITCLASSVSLKMNLLQICAVFAVVITIISSLNGKCHV